ncbi:MAG: serine/threonine protein kinase [Gammaproteobacteria bacterium]
MIDKTPVDAVKPFAGLTPDTVLDAAASLGFEGDGRLFALNSYENRVYQMGRPEGALVLKFYRPGRWSDAQIAEEHSFTAELAEAEMAVASPIVLEGKTLFRFQEFRFAVFPWMRGRAPELDAPEARAMLGRSLARIHRIGAVRQFRTRERLTVDRLGYGAREQLLDTGLLPETLEESYLSATDALLERVDRVIDEVGNVPLLRIHGDCHMGNLLWDEHGPVFVDLDDCVTGPAIQDLWMLLSGSAADQQTQWRDLIEGYEQFGELDYAQLRLIEPLRGLRMLHHAAWIALRWSDPAFPKAFPWFGSTRFWEGHINDLLEQVASIDDPPLLSG